MTLTFCEATVTNCEVISNTCLEAIDVNSWGDGSTKNVTISNCVFNNNICSATSVVTIIGGNKVIVEDNEFIGNTAGSAAIFTATNTEITGNYFANNTYTATNGNEAEILAGPWVAGTYNIVINENAFVGDNFGVFVEDWSTDTTFDLDGNYWNKETNISWKGAADMAVSVYDAKYVEVVEEELLYSTVDSEMIMPAIVANSGETLVSAYDAEGTIYFADGAWTSAIALTAEEIKANAVRKTVLFAETAAGNTYQLTVKSYAGVIDELSDFPKFFNNTAVPSEKNPATYPAVAPNVYGYYIVTKDLGTDVEELSFTQTASTDFTATNGFNGVLDGAGHTLKFKLTQGGLLGLILGTCTIKNVSVIYADATTTYYGVFGYMTNGTPVIDNCYIERTNNPYQKWSVFGIMSRPNAKLILRNTVVYGYNTSNNSAMNSDMWISSESTNAYLIHARTDATGWVNVQNFTKVYYDGIENGAREVPLTDIADASGFDDNYWSKENGKLTWKGATSGMDVSSEGEVTIEHQNLAENGATAYALVLPNNADDTLVTAREELVSFFTKRRA